ncbi:MAG: hypothetical protein JNN30_03705 [Rhodanobacteraceae bacterium]|nr:hypothetical protein [Rhodanobacteraceae bacterium]
MSQPPTDLLPDGIPEEVAVGLLRHLEWQADSFSITFLFADIGPAIALVDWLNRRLALEGQTLRLDQAPAGFVETPEAWLDQLLERWAEQAAQPGSLWALLHAQPADRRWSAARRRFLARFNERRFLLEQRVRRPAVIVLPADARDDAQRMAPDLWHVRAASHRLASPRRGIPVAAAASEQAISAAPPGRGLAYPGAAADWERSTATGDGKAAFLPLAGRAIDELLTSGRLAEAASVAAQALRIARDRTTPLAAGRELSISLDNVGQVARAQGDWSSAERAYRESLEISRQLVERLGGTPESLDDLAFSEFRLSELPGQEQEAWRRTAIARWRDLVARYPTVARYHNQLRQAEARRAGPSANAADSTNHPLDTP